MTRTGEQFRVENNPYGLFVLLRIGHRAMNDVAFRYYEGKEIKRANETKAMSLQMKKQADSMTGR
jgi:hypothetical protein